MNEFGNYLYGLRKAKGMTQQELAGMLGVTNRAVSKWETGEAFPETAQLVPLADIFGVTVDDLLRGRAQSEQNPTAEQETKQPGSEREGDLAPEQKSEREAHGAHSVHAELHKGHREEIIARYMPDGWHKKFALLICIGVALMLAGVLSVIIVGFVTENEAAVCGVVGIMLALIAAGVDLCIIAGINNGMLFLPVPDPMWQKNVKKFSAFISAGVTAIFLAVAAFTVFSSFQDNSAPFITGMVVGFVLLFVGVSLLVYGGVFWGGYSKRATKLLEEQGGEAERDVLAVLHEDKEETIGGKLSGILMLLTTAIFLVMGIVWNLWHPGWIIFPVSGILCGILNIVFGKKK